MGVNDKAIPDKTPVSFILFDNRHLTEKGIEYFLALSKEFVLITTNKNHPAFKLKGDNLHIIYQEQLNMREALQILKTEYGCDELTIQSGGTFNAIFLREKLIDFVNVVLAPVLVGGKDTATLIDGESLSSESELSGLGVLKLIDCKVLQDSYINLRYKVL
jgi:2,5-diamino-6-(ribosylamino)-4(3H)-pyrimidinone 5'-phosphate reductase